MTISNSEVDTFLRCEKLHYFSYVLKLHPKNVSQPNSIGNLGHHILERYYRLQMDGESRRNAFHGGLELLTDAYEHESPEVIDRVMDRFSKYDKFYQNDVFKVISVEGKYYTPLNDHNTFGMTLDLLVEYPVGPRKGLVIIDHKFKYNFDNAEEISMHVQTKKYVWGLKQLGIPVKQAVLNQIRYRPDVKDPDKMFRRQDIKAGPIEEKTIIEEHIRVSEKILERKEKSVEWQERNSDRRFYPKDCGTCYFRIPCRQDLIGVDPEPTFKAMFTTVQDDSYYKPYGYE